MSRNAWPIVLAAALLLAPVAHAQDADAALRGAIEAAERGLPAPPLAADHPAQRWVEMAALRRNIDALPAAQANAFLDRYREFVTSGAEGAVMRS